jgi:hypothetical protein
MIGYAEERRAAHRIDLVGVGSENPSRKECRACRGARARHRCDRFAPRNKPGADIFQTPAPQAGKVQFAPKHPPASETISYVARKEHAYAEAKGARGGNIGKHVLQKLTRAMLAESP